MTPTLTITPLDVALADCRRLHVHFPTSTILDGAYVCRICGVIWLTAAEWAADTGVCPGEMEGGG